LSFSFNLPHRTANKAFTLPLRTIRCSTFVFQLRGSVNAPGVVGNAKTHRTAKLKEVQPTTQSQRIAPHLILLQRSQNI